MMNKNKNKTEKNNNKTRKYNKDRKTNKRDKKERLLINSVIIITIMQDEGISKVSSLISSSSSSRLLQFSSPFQQVNARRVTALIASPSCT
ncbi:hypothetical protein E2C01_068418 [Portunus trituberculatus]|uniref:Uncharacterized protein n=1 Tax=Portunus trituberculatus TaxID=210409 RepID=A0A5B7HVR3_PORTR|nr:hypothetical protein [Portunus trituberculatus]